MNCLLTDCPISKAPPQSTLAKCLIEATAQSRPKRSILFNFGVRRGDIEHKDTTTWPSKLIFTMLKICESVNLLCDLCGKV